MDSGGQCVMTPGTPEMQWLSAGSLVSPQNVRLLISQPVFSEHILLVQTTWSQHYV